MSPSTNPSTKRAIALLAAVAHDVIEEVTILSQIAEELRESHPELANVVRRLVYNANLAAHYAAMNGGHGSAMTTEQMYFRAVNPL